MYKLLEFAGEQEAESLAIVLNALADSMMDRGSSPGSCCVLANKSGHIIVGITDETKDIGKLKKARGEE